MIKPTHWNEERAESYRASGAWAGETLSTRFAKVAADRPHEAAVIDDEALTFSELQARSEAFAAELRRLGVAKGDVVSMQLPNWWEAAVVTLACSRIGAILNPLQMIYRQGEIRFIMRQCRSKVLIAPERFRGTKYCAIGSEVIQDLGHPATLVTVRGSGRDLFGAMPESCEPERTDADDIALILYTSGTTAEPKGVLHTHNTLMRSAQDLVDLFDVGLDDRVFMASPVTHITGLLLGFVMPWMKGAGCVLMDQWESDRALDLILANKCTFTGGAPPFIRGLIDSVQKRGLKPTDVPLTRGPCGGADVPPSLIYAAAETLGARFTRIYGSSEGVTVTGSRSDHPFSFAAETDGPPLPGHEIRIIDDEDSELEAGVNGEVAVRGPSNFVGYFDASLNGDCYTRDGFFRMGDLGQWDANGCVRIQGRKKDIIIRNGENIAAKEVEDLLVSHPMVREVAVVGVPDPQTGERACVFIVPGPGPAPSLSDLCATLEKAQIAKQKYPEYFLLADELPKTASGKVQKFKLREEAKARLGLTSKPGTAHVPPDREGNTLSETPTLRARGSR